MVLELPVVVARLVRLERVSLGQARLLGRSRVLLRRGPLLPDVPARIPVRAPEPGGKVLFVQRRRVLPFLELRVPLLRTGEPVARQGAITEALPAPLFAAEVLQGVDVPQDRRVHCQ